MLVLTRSIDEQIVIGPNSQETVIKIVAIFGDKVRLGIKAPREVSVHRKEIADRISQQKHA